jgi:hypothetical protein
VSIVRTDLVESTALVVVIINSRLSGQAFPTLSAPLRAAVSIGGTGLIESLALVVVDVTNGQNLRRRTRRRASRIGPRSRSRNSTRGHIPRNHELMLGLVRERTPSVRIVLLHAPDAVGVRPLAVAAAESILELIVYRQLVHPTGRQAFRAGVGLPILIFGIAGRARGQGLPAVGGPEYFLLERP